VYFHTFSVPCPKNCRRKWSCLLFSNPLGTTEPDLWAQLKTKDLTSQTSHFKAIYIFVHFISYHLFSFRRSVQDYIIHVYGNGHIFRTQGVRPTQSVQQSHGSVQFFEVAVQYTLLYVIKYNKIK
jgi:hypothetical protein